MSAQLLSRSLLLKLHHSKAPREGADVNKDNGDDDDAVVNEVDKLAFVSTLIEFATSDRTPYVFSTGKPPVSYSFVIHPLIHSVSQSVSH